MPQTLEGSKSLLFGGPGSGKTWSLVTWLEAGKKLAVVFTEREGPKTLLTACRAKGIDTKGRLFYTIVSPGTQKFSELGKQIDLIRKLSYEAISNIKASSGDSDNAQMVKLCAALENFVDDRTGESIGCVADLDTSWCFVLDGATGLNEMSLDVVRQGRFSIGMPHYGIAAEMQRRFISKLIEALSCFVVVIAHENKSVNEVINKLLVYPDLVGQKLGQRIGYGFSDVINAKRSGKKFYWSTTEEGYDLKARMLPLSQSLEPDFKQIIDAWEKLTPVDSEVLEHILKAEPADESEA